MPKTRISMAVRAKIAAMAGAYQRLKAFSKRLEEELVLLRSEILEALDKIDIKRGDFGGVWLNRVWQRTVISGENLSSARKILGRFWTKAYRRVLSHQIDIGYVIKLYQRGELPQGDFQKLMQLVRPVIILHDGGEVSEAHRGLIEFLGEDDPLTELKKAKIGQ